jgi:hypothetical protein
MRKQHSLIKVPEIMERYNITKLELSKNRFALRRRGFLDT